MTPQGEGLARGKRALFPWRAAMSFGFGVLRLSSREFWAMTPRELALAMTARRGVVIGAPDRATLDEMMARFPDRPADLAGIPNIKSNP